MEVNTGAQEGTMVRAAEQALVAAVLALVVAADQLAMMAAALALVVAAAKLARVEAEAQTAVRVVMAA
jgi:hypothetical protein